MIGTSGGAAASTDPSAVSQVPRVVVNIGGRYRMTRRRVRGKPPEYACRLVNISPDDMVFAAPVLGSMKEPITAQFDTLGEIHGEIRRILHGGFALRIHASDYERRKLTDKLVWLDKHQAEGHPDARRFLRMVPKSPHSTLIFGDATTEPCFVIDMSSSGAAVSAEVKPPVGTPLAVGKIIGRVVRHFAEGFAVDFVKVHDPRVVEPWLIKPDLTISAAEQAAARVIEIGRRADA